MNELIIGKPYIKDVGDKARLCSMLTEKDRTYEMWFEVEAEYKKYLCVERIDAFVSAILLYCMRNNISIKSEAHISQKLLYQLQSTYVPVLSKFSGDYQWIRIEAPSCSSKLDNAGAKGTGVSGGVDSFYTILKHYQLEKPIEEFSITHLTFFNVGSHGDLGGEKARELFYKRLKRAGEIANELNLPLVAVDSNVSEFINLSFLSSSSLRSLAAVLALQKLFDGYYFSSGGTINDFSLDTGEIDDIDLLNAYSLGTENLTIFTTGIEAMRGDKLQFISRFHVTYRYLNVCISGDDNCGECDKCIRTMNYLYALGKLDDYSHVFDLSRYYNNIELYLGKMLDNKTGEYYSHQNHREAYELMIQKGKEIPKGAYRYAKNQQKAQFNKKVKNWIKFRVLHKT